MRLTDQELARWLAEARDIYARECSQIGQLLARQSESDDSGIADDIANHRESAEALVRNLEAESSLHSAEWAMAVDTIRRYGSAVQDEHYWNEMAKVAASKPNADPRVVEEYVARSMRAPGTVHSQSTRRADLYRLNALIQVLEQRGG